MHIEFKILFKTKEKQAYYIFKQRQILKFITVSYENHVILKNIKSK